MSLLRPRVRDDRGRWVRLLPYFSPGVRPLREAVSSAAGRFALVVGAAIVGMVSGLLASSALALFLLNVFAGPAGQRGAYPMLDATLACVIWAPIAALSALVAFLLHINLDWRIAAVQAGRRIRSCASCAFDLTATSPEPDGCTVCPECGAAWRLGGEGTKARRHEGTEGLDSAAQAGPQRGQGE